MTTVADVCKYLDRFAPLSLAADWDNVGLLLGDPAAEIQALLTCLTITPDVVREALDSGVGLIVSHHPILFRGAKRITTQNAEGGMLWSLARAGIAVYSPHTAFDNTAGGINDFLAQLLCLKEVTPLKTLEGRQRFKIVVFVPEGDLTRVSDAMFAAGAGTIGNYTECSFRLAGTGTFFGSDAANPTIGQKGRREEANEWRLEVVCPSTALENVISAMRKAHSYEEPAFDVYPLKALSSPIGEGTDRTVAKGDPARRVRPSGKTGVPDHRNAVSRKTESRGSARCHRLRCGKWNVERRVPGQSRCVRHR